MGRFLLVNLIYNFLKTSAQSVVFPGGSEVRKPPAVQEMREMRGMQVPSLGREDPLEKGMATPSRILAEKVPQSEEPGRPLKTGSQKSDVTEATGIHLWSEAICSTGDNSFECCDFQYH